MSSLINNCSNEVKSLHCFLQQWLGGEVQKQDLDFSQITNAFADELILVTPDGRIENKCSLELRLNQAYGIKSGINIWIEDFIPIYETENFLVVGYSEWRKEASFSSGRYTTACFRPEVLAPNNLVWVRIHETWMVSDE
jgi:hypothetical protein